MTSMNSSSGIYPLPNITHTRTNAHTHQSDCPTLQAAPPLPLYTHTFTSTGQYIMHAYTLSWLMSNSYKYACMHVCIHKYKNFTIQFFSRDFSSCVYSFSRYVRTLSLFNTTIVVLYNQNHQFLCCGVRRGVPVWKKSLKSESHIQTRLWEKT